MPVCNVPDRADSGSGGFTLIEVIITGAMFAALVLGVGTAILSVYGVSGRMEQSHLVFAQAQTYANTLTSIRFGRFDDPVPSADDVAEVVDGDGYPGEVSFQQFRQACPLEFELDGFPVPGVWRIEVSDDLNGDGDADDALEGRPDVFRIQVSHEGSTVLSLVRAAGTPFSEASEANAVYGPVAPGNVDPEEEDLLKGKSAKRKHRGFEKLKFGRWKHARGPEKPGEKDED